MFKRQIALWCCGALQTMNAEAKELSFGMFLFQWVNLMFPLMHCDLSDSNVGNFVADKKSAVISVQAPTGSVRPIQIVADENHYTAPRHHKHTS
jgi:hypothetical protein